MFRTLPALFLVLWVSFGPAQEFEIHLHRPARVGGHQWMDLDFHLKRTVIRKTQDKTHKTQVDQRIQMEALFEILAVNGNGEPTSCSVVVKRCDFKTSNERKNPFKSGTIIATRKNHKTRYTSKGRRVFVDEKYVLDQVLRLKEPTDSTLPNMDQMFGTPTPQRKGVLWNLDRNQLNSWFAMDVGAAVRPDQLRGSGKLKKILDVGDERCMEVEIRFRADEMRPPWAPKEAELEKSTFRWAFSGILPLDRSKPVLRDWGEYAFHYRLRSDKGPWRRLEIKQEVKEKHTYRYPRVNDKPFLAEPDPSKVGTSAKKKKPEESANSTDNDF